MEMSAINTTETTITRSPRFDFAKTILPAIFDCWAIPYLARGTGFFKENEGQGSSLEISLLAHRCFRYHLSRPILTIAARQAGRFRNPVIIFLQLDNNVPHYLASTKTLM
jgi:hypothetical protein